MICPPHQTDTLGLAKPAGYQAAICGANRFHTSFSLMYSCLLFDQGKVHQGAGRPIKVYVAYLKTPPLCVVMLPVEVSGEKERGGWGAGL